MHFPQITPPWLLLPRNRVEGICQDQSDVLALSGSFIAACAQIIIGSHSGAQVMSDTADFRYETATYHEHMHILPYIIL